MKLTKTMIDTIKAIAAEANYDMVAIRIQPEPFELGCVGHASHVWIDGEDTGEELNGVCAIRVNMLENISGEYFGNHMAVIGGNHYEYGEDAGEVIIEDAQVIAIIS